MQKSFKEQSKAESLCGNTKGKTIIAIAKTTEDGKHITEKDIEPKHIKILKAPSFFTHAEGARYHIIKLDQKDRFSYAARRAFCEANKKCKL
ncbi:hypothetical protein V1L52_04775 [Treponema sp. HNW]|uniref:hypothetical protein n=1 Tax=Treponema sp. HNW TaxID=3116654 RepID=UPI003D1008CE